MLETILQMLVQLGILTRDNIQQLINILTDLMQKLPDIASNDFATITKNVNIFLWLVEFVRSFLFEFLLRFGLIILFSCQLGLIVFGLMAISQAMIFLKAQRPSWAVIIPFYNDYVMFDIATGKGFLGIINSVMMYAALSLPFFELCCGFDTGIFKILITCASFVLMAFMSFKLASKFNTGVFFAVGLLFLPIIFYPVLGFGDFEYESEDQFDDIAKV